MTDLAQTHTQHSSPFFALEFWFDVVNFKSTRFYDQQKLQLTAQYIHRTYLRPQGEKRLFATEATTTTHEVEKILRDIATTLEEGKASKTLFDGLTAYLTAWLNLDGVLSQKVERALLSGEIHKPDPAKPEEVKSRIRNFYQELHYGPKTDPESEDQSSSSSNAKTQNRGSTDQVHQLVSREFLSRASASSPSVSGTSQPTGRTSRVLAPTSKDNKPHSASTGSNSQSAQNASNSSSSANNSSGGISRPDSSGKDKDKSGAAVKFATFDSTILNNDKSSNRDSEGSTGRGSTFLSRDSFHADPLGSIKRTLGNIKGKNESSGNGEPVEITRSFARLMRVTVIGTDANVNYVLSLLKEEMFVLADTLILVVPFRYTNRSSRFLASVFLRSPGLIIYTNSADVEKYQFFQGFAKHPYIIVDVTTQSRGSQPSVPVPKNARRFNYPNIMFEKSQSSSARTELLLRRLETIVKERKENIGQTLNAEFPPYISEVMNTLLRLRMTSKMTSTNRLMNIFLEAICGASSRMHGAEAGTQQQSEASSIPGVICDVVIYDDLLLQRKRQFWTRDEVQAGVLSVKDMLVRFFRQSESALGGCRVYLFDSQSYPCGVENIPLDTTVLSLVDRKIPIFLHFFPNWNDFKATIFTVLSRAGWITSISPDDYNSDFYLLELDMIAGALNTFLSIGDTSHTNFTVSVEKMRESIEASCQPFRQTVEHNYKDVLLTFLQNYELVFFDRVSKKYFVPYLVLGSTLKKAIYLEFLNSKRERRLKRYFVVAREMAISMPDRVFATIHSSAFAANIVSCSSFFVRDALTLLLRLSATHLPPSSIAVQFDANTISLEFSGSIVDVPVFCRLCELVRVLCRNLYYRAEVKEVVECTNCKNDAFTLDFLFQLMVKGEPLCCQEGPKIELEHIAPDLFLPLVNHVQPTTIEGKLGEGAFGVVNRGTLMTEEGRIEIAIKKFKTIGNTINWTAFKEFQFEAMIAKDFDNKYILRQFGVDLNEHALIIELANCGTLGDLLHKNATDLPTNLRKKMCIEVASGLSYLHNIEPPIIHRDLRSYNVFVISLDPAQEVNVKIGDFGLSVRSVCDPPTNEALESWQWLAPEVILGKNYDKSSDIFSLAVLCYEVFSRTLPYTNYSNLLITLTMPLNEATSEAERERAGYTLEDGMLVRREFNVMVAKDQVCAGLRPKLPDEFQPRLNALLDRMWNDTIYKRPMAEQVVAELRALEERDFLGSGSVETIKYKGINVFATSIVSELERLSRMRQVQQAESREGTPPSGNASLADESEDTSRVLHNLKNIRKRQTIEEVFQRMEDGNEESDLERTQDEPESRVSLNNSNSGRKLPNPRSPYEIHIPHSLPSDPTERQHSSNPLSPRSFQIVDSNTYHNSRNEQQHSSNPLSPRTRVDHSIVSSSAPESQVSPRSALLVATWFPRRVSVSAANSPMVSITPTTSPGNSNASLPSNQPVNLSSSSHNLAAPTVSPRRVSEGAQIGSPRRNSSNAATVHSLVHSNSNVNLSNSSSNASLTNNNTNSASNGNGNLSGTAPTGSNASPGNSPRGRFITSSNISPRERGVTAYRQQPPIPSGATISNSANSSPPQSQSNFSAIANSSGSVSTTGANRESSSRLTPNVEPRSQSNLTKMRMSAGTLVEELNQRNFTVTGRDNANNNNSSGDTILRSVSSNGALVSNSLHISGGNINTFGLNGQSNSYNAPILQRASEGSRRTLPQIPISASSPTILYNTNQVNPSNANDCNTSQSNYYNPASSVTTTNSQPQLNFSGGFSASTSQASQQTTTSSGSNGPSKTSPRSPSPRSQLAHMMSANLSTSGQSHSQQANLSASSGINDSKLTSKSTK